MNKTRHIHPTNAARLTGGRSAEADLGSVFRGEGAFTIAEMIAAAIANGPTAGAPSMTGQTKVPNKQRAGFTLGEVMITLCLTAMMCVAVFTGLGTISRLTMAVAIRSEADRLMQAEAERLTSVDFTSFVASSSDQTITGCLKTSFLSGNQAQFAYPATSSSGRVTFTRRVVAVASTSTTKTLRVEVQWTWQGRPSLISTVLFRSQ